MISVKASTVVERPAEAVWAYISNLDNLKDWDPGVVDVDWRPPVGLGSTYTVRVKVGLTLVGDGRISGYVVNRVFGLESRPRAPGRITGRGGSWVRGTYTTDPFGEGRTKLTRVMELEARGLLRLLGPLLAPLAKRARHEEIDNIKRIVEAGGTS